MRLVPSLLAAAILLTACQAQLAVGPRPGPEAPARKSPARTAASPAAKASPSDAGNVLVRPADAARALRGQVRLDAAYLVSAGAGNLVGADGASLVGPDGAALGGAAAAVAVSGTPLVTAGAGNAIAAASLLGADGASLVGADGASLVGADGASLVGGPQAYTLAQAGTPARASGLRAGQQLPAAGMVVAAVSLATGKLLPVGQDGAGAPVYAVYTDAAGGFALFPPADARGNLRIVAVAAGSADPRLRYGVFAGEGGTGERNLSEASSLAASYLGLCVRQVFDGFLRKGFTSRIETTIAEAERLGVSTPEMLAMRRIERTAAEIGYESWPAEADRQALLGRIVDIGLSGVAFDELMSLSGEPALPVLEAHLARTEGEIAALMASPPAGKTAQSMFDEVPSFNGAKILRPADYNAFVVTKIIAPDPLDTSRISERISVLRLEIGLQVSEKLSADLTQASYGIANDLGARMLTPDPVTGAQPISDAIVAAMRAFVPAGQ